MTDQNRDIVDRFRDAQLNHDEFRFGWLAEANDELTTLREERDTLRRRVAELEAVVEREKLRLLATVKSFAAIATGGLLGFNFYIRPRHRLREIKRIADQIIAAEAAVAKQKGGEE